MISVSQQAPQGAYTQINERNINLNKKTMSNFNLAQFEASVIQLFPQAGIYIPPW